MEYGFGIWGRRKVMAVAMAGVTASMAIAIATAQPGVSLMSSPTGSLRSGGLVIHRESVLLLSE